MRYRGCLQGGYTLVKSVEFTGSTRRTRSGDSSLVAIDGWNCRFENEVLGGGFFKP